MKQLVYRLSYQADYRLSKKEWYNYYVALHVVFDGRESHDAYQEAPEHLEFIEGQKDNWKKVRVFDSDVEGAD